jgi:monoamine oxidase
VTRRQTDIVIIGAGAAGLAAARRLHERGIEFLVVEARDRIGGRAYTLPDREGSPPIELGAEFIHGDAPDTVALMKECGEAPLEVATEALQLSDGRLEEDFAIWEAAAHVLQRVDVRGPDQTVDAFLNTVDRDEVPAEEADSVRTIVEGFDAAISSDASMIAIAKEWLGSNRLIRRPPHGYAPLMEWAARTAGARILRQTRVNEIRWSRDNVRVRTTGADGPMEIAARRAIVTLPIGVLRENAVSFSPPLPAEKQRAIDAIAMGPALRITLEFRSPFWEHIDGGRFRDAGFFYAPQCELRTLWTRFPQRSSFLVAWAGGGAVERLAEARIDPVEAALKTCEAIFPSAGVRGELRATYHHDWQSDPLSFGAYSYLRAGGGDARSSLGHPIEETLFFAGEATSSADPGTVNGALASGYRAAGEVP